MNRRIACLVLLALAAPLLAQAKKKEPKKADLGVDQETFDAFMKLVEEAGTKQDFRMDPKIGRGSTAFEDSPSKPGVVVGAVLYPGIRNKSTQYIRGIRVIYLNKDGVKTQSSIRGHVATEAGSIRIEAKPGYALTGWKANTSVGIIDGLSLTFQKITATGLNPDDSYETKYYGSEDPLKARYHGGHGEAVLGVHGLLADNAKSHDFALGLILMGKTAKPKEKK